MFNGPRSRIVLEGLRASILLLCLPAILLAAAYLVGTRLPKEHTATASAIIQAPAPRVWELLTDFSSELNWRKGPLIVVRAPNRRGDSEPCWVEGWLLRKTSLCAVDNEQTGRRVVNMNPTSRPSETATWTYQIIPDPASSANTKLTVTATSTITPPLLRFIGRYILREHTAVDQYVRDVQAEATRSR